MTDPEQYDQARTVTAQSAGQPLFVLTRSYSCYAIRYSPQLAKVEPLERALRELRADAWINGAPPAARTPRIAAAVC